MAVEVMIYWKGNVRANKKEREFVATKQLGTTVIEADKNVLVVCN